MTLIMVMHLFPKTNTQHCYNKSYKIPICVYMIQSQLKAIRYLPTWILKLCKAKAIRNLESPKTLKQTRAFCGMVNFLSSFLPNL